MICVCVRACVHAHTCVCVRFVCICILNELKEQHVELAELQREKLREILTYFNCVCACMFVYARVRVCVCVYVRVCVRVYARTRVCLCA